MQVFTTLKTSELEQVISAAVREGLLGLQTPQRPVEEDRIGIDEACRITGYSKATIYKMTFTGEIPFQKFGKRLVFSRQTLSDWMNDRTITTKQADKTVTDRLRNEAKRRRA
ncbi:MAG: helix-turn-helix domain-containing protein [Bacteroidales bacterium]|jgi:excisionase family DNA binding protein|nr:helix-turn-helix domain-containing protein [Bacteroidales bacterium]